RRYSAHPVYGELPGVCRVAKRHPDYPDHAAVPADSSATHSRCWVIGNASNARSLVNRYPAASNVATSRANAAGSQETYTTRLGRAAEMEEHTSELQSRFD